MARHGEAWQATTFNIITVLDVLCDATPTLMHTTSTRSVSCQDRPLGPWAETDVISVAQNASLTTYYDQSMYVGRITYNDEPIEALQGVNGITWCEIYVKVRMLDSRLVVRSN